MSRKLHPVAFLCLAALASGCSDSPRVLLRDTLTTWNELADALHRIPDDPERAEEVAEQLLKFEIKSLKEKMEKVKKRFSIKLEGDKLDKDERKALAAAMEELKEEARFTISRIAGELGGKVCVGEDRYYQPQWKVVKTEEARLHVLLKRITDPPPDGLG